MRSASHGVWGIVFFVLFSACSVSAAIHEIRFGNDLVYDPDELVVFSGDTIRWIGDFSEHPMSSTTIPQGAQTWSVDAGTQFDYKIAVPGLYHYRCDVHFQLGMTGSLSALPTSINNRQNSMRQQTARENSQLLNTGTGVVIQHSSGAPSERNMRVFNLVGRNGLPRD